MFQIEGSSEKKSWRGFYCVVFCKIYSYMVHYSSPQLWHVLAVFSRSLVDHGVESPEGDALQAVRTAPGDGGATTVYTRLPEQPHILPRH